MCPLIYVELPDHRIFSYEYVSSSFLFVPKVTGNQTFVKFKVGETAKFALGQE